MLPRGFQTLEDVILINLKPELVPKATVIGEAYLSLLPYIHSVWMKEFGKAKVVGQFRTPTGVIHVAGEEKSEVVAVENGVSFKHDFTKIIFSKGNIAERSYLPGLVRPGERILDMFAGIGYFSLMIAKHAKPAIIHACEINPVSHGYLIENIALNELGDVIVPHQGDCKETVETLAAGGFVADRIIMGVFPAPVDYLPDAFKVARAGEGTIIHYEGKVSDKNIDPLVGHVATAIDSDARLSKFKLLECRFVKNVGVNQQHAVLDILVT